jgi:hypothetical protein
MPVNTAALKSFAPAMRRQLLEAVGRKLDLLLNSQTPDTLSTYARQIAELREQAAENRDQLLEKVAYTWFNRLCALRYLDARGWHPFGCKVLMPAGKGETQPELLKLMRAGSLPAALKGHTDEGRLHDLLDGQIQTAIAGADPQGEVYRSLVLATCRFYHELLPNLFEGLDDASELLLPDDLLSEGAIAGSFRREISDDDCRDVEILGWLYQFYISEKKDEAMARKKAVPIEDIPAVTQLFTPHWIVRYLVENSLGRLWLLNRPGSKLREQMPYYIEGDAEMDFLKISKPEEIRLLDPACGSGHMLTYAFDLLTVIYEEEGYAPSEIPGLILQHNLHGLEICPRAAQLAELALVFKAREKSRRFFQPEQLVRPQILELQDVHFEEDELNTYVEVLDLGEAFDQKMFKLFHQFEEAKDFGSLIQPCLDERATACALRTIEAKDLGDHLFLRDTHLKVLRVLEQAEALTQRYHVVVANPPYMGSGAMSGQLKSIAKSRYPRSKTDFFAMFIERTFTLCVSYGFSALVTMHGWMFLSTFEELRRALISSVHLKSLIHIGPRGFDSISGEVVQTAAFVLENRQSSGGSGTFIRLVEGDSEEEKVRLLEEALEKRSQGLVFTVTGNQFDIIAGSPIAYWVSEAFRSCFDGISTLGERALFRQGMSTTDSGRFEREWHEIDRVKLNLKRVTPITMEEPSAYWYPFNKGGSKRRWYGNLETIVRYERNGQDLMDLVRRKYPKISDPEFVIKNRNYFFLPAITYASIGTGSFISRSVPAGCAYSVAGPAIFSEGWDPRCLLGLLCSITTTKFLEAINPTLGFQITDVSKIPLGDSLKQRVEVDASNLAEQAISVARADWDNFEISWDFRDQPMLRSELKAPTLEASWRNWEAQCTAAIRQMQALETENNRLFIDAYGLESELQPEVNEEQITLARADSRKDTAAFLSYAICCMMGRYSLDQPGLILADSRDSQAEQLAAYEEKVGKPLGHVLFKPDADAIIPVLDGEWFEDDIVARTREFLEVNFPESTVSENLRFIEESLGKDIRKYFCSDFYKDHLQTYKKRPIYWMVQSPKKGFACLIYLHRYTKDTLNQVLNNYFRPYLQKLEARQAQLGLDQLNDDLPTRERTAARKEAEKITKVLKECEAWEQDALLPLAQQRIELDLDDGVKVNYLKLQDVLAAIPGLAAKED